MHPLARGSVRPAATATASVLDERSRREMMFESGSALDTTAACSGGGSGDVLEAVAGAADVSCWIGGPGPRYRQRVALAVIIHFVMIHDKDVSKHRNAGSDFNPSA